ncbi:ankyrin repeat domain-containing protein [Verrucomicrobia bacterium]|nr:ankyrin repeat domain-containing protein [Verrucomicrobiota bacterium]
MKEAPQSVNVTQITLIFSAMQTVKILYILTFSCFLLAGCGNPNSFREAAADGNVKTVKSGLSSSVDINSQDPKNGYTALHLASSNDHKAIVKLLVENGADINILNLRGQTPLDLSSTESTDRFLRKNGAKTAAELKATN